MAEFEFAGTTFKGGKMFAVLTALSTLGGGAWGAFEFYADYMDMKEIVQNIDIDEIQSANVLQLQKLEDAIGYTQDIKNDLKSDISRSEDLVGQLEDQIIDMGTTVRDLRTDVYAKLDAFEERLRVTLKDNQDTMANLRDKISTNLENSEARIKATQASIGGTLEGVRTEMNQVQKDVTASIREVEANTRQTDKDIRTDMKALDKSLAEKLQEALNNPLAN
jgi:predicted  nucleic acid-binding Zn-ribbon protein